MGLMTILGNVFSLALAAWALWTNHFKTRLPNYAVIHQGMYIFYMVTFIALLIGALVTIAGYP